MAVRVATSSQRHTTARDRICGRGEEDLAMPLMRFKKRNEGEVVFTMARTSKNLLGSSAAIVLVLTAKTPIGKVKPHHPCYRLVLTSDQIESTGSDHIEGELRSANARHSKE